MQRPERKSFRELPAFTQSVEPPKPPPRLPLNPTDEERAAYEQERGERLTLRCGGVPGRNHDVKRPKMKYPEDFPRYTQMLNSPRVLVPDLPKNPTEEEKAAYDQALQDRLIRKFDCFNSMVDDVDAYHNRPIEAEPDPGKQERWRPRMHPLPAPPEFEAAWNAHEKSVKELSMSVDNASHGELNAEMIGDTTGEINGGTNLETNSETNMDMTPQPQKTALGRLNMNKHESHCTVCRHPEREAIEQEFIHWLSPRATADDFEIDVRAIYRHAHAFNLFAVRNRKIRFVLSHALERAEHAAPPTPADLNRMVRTFTRVNDDGQWIEPPAHVIVSSGSLAAAPRDSAQWPPEPVNETIDAGMTDLGADCFSTRRAEKNTSQIVENNQRRTTFLDTQNQGARAAKTKRKAKG